MGDRAIVLPTADAQPTDNPYVAYNCLRYHKGMAVVANGSHVDPIIEKVAAGYPLRDALALSLLAMDYEHDDYCTPRVAAGLSQGAAHLAIVTPERLCVQTVRPEAGVAMLIATYELVEPVRTRIHSESAADLARELYDLDYEQPIASVAMLMGDTPSIAVYGPAASG